MERIAAGGGEEMHPTIANILGVVWIIVGVFVIFGQALLPLIEL
jgi:hypothetical protein